MIVDSAVFIPFHLPIDWSADYQHQTSNILSKKNFVVCYLDYKSDSLFRFIHKYFLKKKSRKIIKKIKKNVIHVYPIHILPFERVQTIHKLNQKMSVFLTLLILKFLFYHKQKIIWNFDSKFYFLNNFFKKSFFHLYDCVDYCPQKEERRNILSADKVVVNSNTLYNLYKNLRKDIAVVPQGFRIQDFRNFNIKKINSAIKLPKGKPIIGFTGGINYRLDFDLLFKLILENQQWNFVFVGPKQKYPVDNIFKTAKKTKKLFSLKNTFFLGKQPKKHIPQIISQFDICMIPYNTSLQFNKYCYPMKLFEYFYMRKPIVTTPIEELKKFPKLVKIGKDASEFEKHIKTILKSGWPKEYQKIQKKLAVANSWKKKIEAVSKVLKRNNNENKKQNKKN